jgi:hypothetical protein
MISVEERVDFAILSLKIKNQSIKNQSNLEGNCKSCGGGSSSKPALDLKESFLYLISAKARPMRLSYPICRPHAECICRSCARSYLSLRLSPSRQHMCFDQYRDPSRMTRFLDSVGGGGSVHLCQSWTLPGQDNVSSWSIKSSL